MDAGDALALFSIGDAWLQVIEDAHLVGDDPHDTLAWFRQRTWSFSVPDVFFHAHHQNRYYMITSRMRGEVLQDMWPRLNEEQRDYHASRVADVIKEAAVPPPDSSAHWHFRNVYGGPLIDNFLADENHDMNPSSLRKRAEGFGLDCSRFALNMNLVVDRMVVDTENDDHISIIEMHAVGYVPVDWILTKWIRFGADLHQGDDLGDRFDFRKRVARYLKAMGYYAEPRLYNWLMRSGKNEES